MNRTRSKETILAASGGCVVPFPPVVCKGKNPAAEKNREIFENHSYELFGIDGHCSYYGTYRCIKVATMNWTELTSLGWEFIAGFLDSTVVNDGHSAPVLHSFIKNMYMTGILPAGCVALRFEGFDENTVEMMQSADVQSVLRDKFFYGLKKRRPDADGGLQGPSKKPKFRRNQVKSQGSR